MTSIYTVDQIRRALDGVDVSALIEQGFEVYSRGEVVVPPVGELTFEHPPGDTHIKYGYIKNDNHYVIKIASGFYENPMLDLPSNSGLMLVFSQQTGQLKSILLDEGYLTDVRTAVAGQVAARYLTPSKVEAIGVLGLGIQGRMQVEYLKSVTDCRKVIAWGRSAEKLNKYRADMEAFGFDVQGTQKTEELCDACNLIVTTTPSQTPLIATDMIRPGTHITAMGSDTAEKQELEVGVLAKADIVVVDSIQQCLKRGEAHKAIQAGLISENSLNELGHIISGRFPGRTSDAQITVADLTGVAVQDIQIAKAVCTALEKNRF